MSGPVETNNRKVLVVSDADDDGLHHYVETLVAAGFVVEPVRDVYSAMAHLVLNKGGSHVLLDVRTMDDRELTFPRAVNRYFPSVQIAVPNLPETARRLSANAESFRIADAAELVEAWSRRPAVSPATPPGSQAGPQDGSGAAASARLSSALSTDTSGETTEGQPSLHDAVRARMAGSEAIGVRRSPPRTPPGSAALKSSSSGAPPNLSPMNLSAEEMEALLEDEPAATADEPPRAGEPPGESP